VSCRSFFDVRFRSKKYAGHIFRTESEALAERPAEEGLEGQEPRGTRRVEDLNRRAPRGLAREWAPATLSRRRYSCAGEASAVAGVPLATARHMETGVVLGEPGCAYPAESVRGGERGRRDPPAAEARRGESLFSRRKAKTAASRLNS